MAEGERQPFNNYEWPSYPSLPDAAKDLNITPGEKQTIRIHINKDTHLPGRYDKELETEHEAILIIEPKT